MIELKAAIHSTTELRRANRNRVYRHLYETPEVQTKQDVAQALSMSLPTLSQNLTELLGLGLIDNSKIANSTGGRKPRILSIVPAARYAVGAEISPHHIHMVAVDLCINELGSRNVTREFQPNEAYARGLAQDLENFLDEVGLDRKKLLGVGLTLPGIVNADRQTLRSAPTLRVHQLNMNFLTCHIPYAVILSNDANAGGFAEWWNHTDLTSMVYLSLGRGVGGAILINGVPYEGGNQRSGEFGHMYIHPGGRECSCGRTGCLEAYCSTALLSDDLGITLEEFFASVEAGNQNNVRIWEQYLDDLAIGIVNIHTTLDCDVVLGGTLSQHLRGWIEMLKDRLKCRAFAEEDISYLHLCRYDGKSNSIGAALRFVDEFLREV